MITIPTVFVLGAGASSHLGYPTGLALVERIVRGLQSSTPDSSFLRECGYSNDDIRQFSDELASSSKGSVDAFLEHRTEFLEIGKLAIAKALTADEYQGKLVDVKQRHRNWYCYLYEKMNAPFDQFSQNKIGVITFNYDRSLEQFLFTALRSSYGKTDNEVAAQLDQLPIIHVYGQLSRLPWQEATGRAYTHNNSKEDLMKSAAGIKIVHESTPLGLEFDEAKKLLKNTKRIYFLGFHYHEINMERLGSDWIVGKEIQGSCYQFSNKERGELVSKYNGKIELGPPQLDSMGFLREIVRFN